MYSVIINAVWSWIVFFEVSVESHLTLWIVFWKHLHLTIRVKSHFTIKQKLGLSGWSDCSEGLCLMWTQLVGSPFPQADVRIYCPQFCDCRMNKAVVPKTYQVKDWNSDNVHKFCPLLACNSEAEQYIYTCQMCSIIHALLWTVLPPI